ncbi:enoyl-CoA hydratase-related protein [Porphyromonas levii]|uniref:Enoyl-CoA hydratase/isomerase family protein n=1 Tax=Porphyromonas levii TaxID=28114 RepID=A0A4Y8WRM5_9PORP|nr:enoyl-CoA hydratase-related protein [Porphyromonas levii]MBR8713298.1 Short-chain-enoyl-CoA hydratase [Porphyromonas levii]MBR8715292.1 Short-chain-enoyl-CoA hydratase [Porphyromonas levii]MBR8727818.1 Short-chain-enoyl-CoA hydratase [Porphyromonas levii]MBR8731088.1 Short-chain-enoyl-CoA hydratase [Porphyromonas levii]MBR8736162.1 Short-chain-enoyl-CoA hydratase [Porphyromonas levii]
MADFKTIKVEVSGAICTLTINRPEALNALSTQVLTELEQAIDHLPDAKVLVVTGEGRSFVAGADISEMASFSAEQALTFGAQGAKVFRKLELLDIPVIAAVNGFALGGGCELAMACDIRIASDKAKFGQPEVGLGIPPGFSGTQRLPRLVGAGIASELIFTARTIKADEALRIGLVNQVVEAEQLMPTVMSIAEEISTKSPHAVALSKKAIQRGLQADIDTGIAIENYLFSNAFASSEQKEGMAAFLEKRKPNF